MAEERGLGGMMWQHIKRSTKDALKPFKTREEMQASEDKFKEKGAHLGRGLKSAGKYLFADPAVDFLKTWEKGTKDPNSLTQQDHATLLMGLLGVSGSSPGAGVANIGRKQAREAIVAGMAQHSPGKSLKRYKGKWYNPMDHLRRWGTERSRANARRMLKDTNKIPQSFLDPIKDIKIKKIEGDAVAYAQGRSVRLDPFKDQTKYHSMLHEPHHVFTFQKKLEFLSKADKHRTIKAKALTHENNAQHLAKTYEQNYGTIGSEVSARKFEEIGGGFPQGTRKEQWERLYDRSLDEGLDSMQAHYPNWQNAMEASSRQTHEKWKYYQKQKEALDSVQQTPPPLPKKKPAGRNET